MLFLAELKMRVLTFLYLYHLLNLRYYEAEAFLPIMHCSVKISADCHVFEQQQGVISSQAYLSAFNCL